jgi:opacity protein-like surface antigen
MRKFLFATAALIALASPASAADMRLPVYKAAPVVPAWSWTGCFLGGHAGGLWATQKDWIVRTPAAIFSASRSANTMSIAGSVAPRPVATINLPAAS